MFVRLVNFKEQNIRTEVEILISYLNKNKIYTMQPIPLEGWCKVTRVSYPPLVCFDGKEFWVAPKRLTIFC